MNKRALILVILATVVLGAGAVAFRYYGFTSRKVKYDSGPGPEARRNRFLALGKYLETQYGWNVSYSYGYSSNYYGDLAIVPLELLPIPDEGEYINPSADYLVTGLGSFPRGVFPPAQYRDKSFLRELGIESLEDLGDREPEKKNPDGSPIADNVRTTDLDGDELSYVAPRRFVVNFSDPLVPSVAGKGVDSTTLSSLEILANDQIDQHDHVVIADAIFQEFELPPGSQVLIVHGRYTPRIWAWLISSGLLITVLTLSMLAMVLWHWLPRTGPILIESEGERRSLAEHLHAGAKFLLSYRHFESLFAAARRSVTEKMRLGSARPAKEDQLRWSARASGVSEALIEQAVSAPLDRRHVIRCAQTLHELNQKL